MRVNFLHVVGARPNIPKLAPVFQSLAERGATQLVAHTGQHFSPALSDDMFNDLELKQPDYNFNIGRTSVVQQMAQVMVHLESLLKATSPSFVILYGDVNSTAAAAAAASKLHTPSVHVEAGLRSFDRSMPEEINRLVTDQLCDYLLTTSPEAATNLAREGREAGAIKFVGNPMIDSLRRVQDSLPTMPYANRFTTTGYGLLTLHRPSNVDYRSTRSAIIEAILECANSLPIVFPVHPRKRSEIFSSELARHPNVHLTNPMGYKAFLSTMRDSRVIITDSGGVQEEATALSVPCLTMRPNTERPVTMTHGTNRLVNSKTVVSALKSALAAEPKVKPMPPLWDGHAGTRIAQHLMDLLNS